jgi:aromatic amino acid aminotransferase I
MDSDCLYVQLKLHFDRHPKHGVIDSKDLELALWEELAEAGVLFGPGQMFAADATVQEAEDQGHFRISFSNAEVSTEQFFFAGWPTHLDQIFPSSTTSRRRYPYSL